MKNDKKLLIGGQALRELGSDRYTNDIDYLVNIAGNKKPFICTEGVDIVNAGGHDFFMKVWKMEAKNEGPIATPNALLELKAFALVQHCQLGNWAKADACEYDIKFLVRQCGAKLTIVQNFISVGELKEINKIINSVKI